ncbi:MAG TPA: DM13 domain-containing protein [Candidatus Limnocylindrales bacterium]|nr:DM13 domain-containing protein [Candidatus Limnocylindrales bacterium]
MAWLGDLGSAVLGALYANVALVTVGGILAAIALVLVGRRLGWFAAARRHPRRSIGAVAAALAVALPLGWYLASPLVLSATVDEPAPVIAARPSPSVASPSPAASGTPRPTAATSPEPPRPTDPPALIERSGAFRGSDEFHFGRGTARLIEVAPGSYVVRLEDFAVRNGPDLYVYLSPRADGWTREAIELGRLKADTGNQNYAVPAGALDDPAIARSVVIWCKQFSHLFATAALAD